MLFFSRVQQQLVFSFWSKLIIITNDIEISGNADPEKKISLCDCLSKDFTENKLDKHCKLTS